MRTLTLLMSVLFLASCLSTNEIPGSGSGVQKGTKFIEFEPDTPDVGHIYIYRPDKYFWHLIYPNITINEQEAGELRNGTYIVAEVSPGTHKVVAHRNRYWAVPDAVAVVDIEAGKNVVIKVEPQLENIMQVVSVATKAALLTGTVDAAFGVNGIGVPAGIAAIDESDFEGAASSSASVSGEELFEEIFRELLLSNKAHITNQPIGTELTPK